MAHQREQLNELSGTAVMVHTVYGMQTVGNTYYHMKVITSCRGADITTRVIVQIATRI